MLSLVCSNGFSFVNLDVDLSLYKKEPCLQLLGRCDGIICLSKYRVDIVLCSGVARNFDQWVPKFIATVIDFEEKKIDILYSNAYQFFFY